MRRICRASLLSYTRMRELDRHSHPIAGNGRGAENRGGQPAAGQEAYSAIHRSILSGLLGHIAQRVDRNVNKASGNPPGHALAGVWLVRTEQSSRRTLTGRRRNRTTETLEQGASALGLWRAKSWRLSRLFGSADHRGCCTPIGSPNWASTSANALLARPFHGSADRACAGFGNG